MRPSIISGERKCFVTGARNVVLDVRHIFNGSCRDWADKEGLWVYLAHDKHMELHDSNPVLKIELKRVGQHYYELSHTREEFMKHTHKNYLSSPLTDEEKMKYHIPEKIDDSGLDLTEDKLLWEL